jgi:prolyl oligopeptidase
VALPMIAISCGSSVRAKHAFTPTVVMDKPLSYHQVPATRRDDTVDTIHGETVHDPYRWLEDGQYSDVKKWADTQDLYARGYLKRIETRPQIRATIERSMILGDTFPPQVRGDRRFSLRRAAASDKAIVYVRDATGSDRILIDPGIWPQASTLKQYWPSRSGNYIAYNVSKTGADAAELRLREVATGKDLEQETIEDTRYASVCWNGDSSGFYYIWSPPGNVDERERLGRAELRFHRLGTDAKSDTTLRRNGGDPSALMYAIISPDGRWLVLHIEFGFARSDVFILDTLKSGASWSTVTTGRKARYDVVSWGDNLFVVTDDDAAGQRVVRTSVLRPSLVNAREIVSARRGYTIESLQIIGEHVVLLITSDATRTLEIRDVDGRLIKQTALPQVGNISDVSGTEWDNVGYFRFSTYTTPAEIYSFSANTGEVALVETVALPFDSSVYIAERASFVSPDGTRAPMFIARRRDTKRDGRAPAILYGYGGFQASMVPRFRPGLLAWLDAGGIYVEAVLRGGGEFGEAWHRAGMGANKPRVFEDFIAAAEELVRSGWTVPSRLAAKGQSNGGLLVCAAITQRPDLFRVGLSRVPLTDMIRYTRVGAGALWTEEYGDPSNKDSFKTLFSYSPYHRIDSGKRYPAMLVMTADADDRVDPMHARKFVAAMQAATTGGPVLLRVQKDAGHMGAGAVASWVEDDADMYAFALDQMGIRVTATNREGR